MIHSEEKDPSMTSLFTTQDRGQPALCSLRFAASLVVLIGFFGPWVAHKTAALTVTGYELSEFAKFFPQVQGDVVAVQRGLFVAPLLTGVVSLALVIHRSKARPLFRFGATALAMLLGLSALPPYHSLLGPGYGLQLALVGVGLLLTVLTPLTTQLSERMRGILFLFVALTGTIPALRQFVLLRPLIAALYGARILPGWGLIVCVIGFLLLSLTSLRGILTS